MPKQPEKKGIKNSSVRNLAMRFVKDDGDEVRSRKEVIESARSHTAFQLDMAQAKNSSSNDYSFADWGDRPKTIYKIVPERHILMNPDLRKAFRVDLQCCIADAFSGRRKRPLLVVCDEYLQIANGGLESVQLAIAAGRKFGIQFLLSVTSWAELCGIHGQEAASAMYNNMGFVQWLQATSLTDSKILSELCGEREVYASSKSLNNDPEKETYSINESMSVRTQKLMLPHEVRQQLGTNGTEIVFMDGVAGRGPLKLTAKSYWEFPELAGVAGKNAYYERSK